MKASEAAARLFVWSTTIEEEMPFPATMKWDSWSNTDSGTDRCTPAHDDVENFPGLSSPGKRNMPTDSARQAAADKHAADMLKKYNAKAAVP